MVSGLIDDYPNTFAVVSAHIGDDGYEIPWGGARADFYNVTGIPSFMYDGLQDAWPIGTYEAKFLARQAITTDVTIELTGSEAGEQTYEITARVCLEPAGTSKEMRVYMVQVLDHYPVPPSYSRNCLMQGAPTEDIDLNAGQCRNVKKTFTFDSTSWADQEEIKIIAWAQEPLSSYPAEVYQARTMTWPFPPSKLQIDWVTVGDPGNTADDEVMIDATTGYGSVDHEYLIGKHEVTNREYRQFLENVATVGDPNGLWNPNMEGTHGGIARTGSGTVGDPYQYAAKDDDPDWDDRPVNFVSWYDALRFANWLHNGQPEGAQDAATTEDGAYDMSLGASVVRKPGAVVFLPSEDEWYKAAYYKGGGTNAGYWDYPTQGDTAPCAEIPPGTCPQGAANYDDVVGPLYYTTQVGAYLAKPSDSAYGTFDQGGNVREWNEADVLGDGSSRGQRGGSWSSGAASLQASDRANSLATLESSDEGFRIAGLEDCNENGIPDECDLDCTTGGRCNVPGCGLATDCFAEGILDECSIANCPGGDPRCDDCNENLIPDTCDIDPSDPDGNGQVSADCDENNVPDECQADCQPNGIPDICDVNPADPDGDGQVSADSNGNNLPDECEWGPPLPAPYPHNRAKNRYITFDPDKETNDGLNLAFKVTLTSLTLGSCSGNGAPCRTDDDCRACSVTGTPCITVAADCEPGEVQTCDLTGETCVNDQAGSVGHSWWIGPEHPSANGVHLLVTEAYRKVSNAWPQVVQASDCEVVPIATFEVRAVSVGSGPPELESDAVEVSTTAKPNHWWADCVGELGSYCTLSWTPCTVDGDCALGSCYWTGWACHTDANCAGGTDVCVGGEVCIEIWPPADGFTNFQDVNAAVFTFSGLPTVMPTEVRNLDLHGNDAGNPKVDPPNQVVNFSDIANIVAAFEGRPYPYTDPVECPDIGAWPAP